VILSPPTRYRSDDEESGRWDDFPFRDGDIVISTRSKSGTTWMQMICALLVFQTPELPQPLAELSPWLDWLVTPRDEVVGALEAQDHRRFIKTHTPLDGLPLDPRATFIVVARHPLDAAVSLYYQGENLRSRSQPRPPIDEWLRSWISWEGEPAAQLDSLPGFMWHLSDAWSRRGAENVVLVHYADLVRNLEAEMRWLAAALNMGISDESIGDLAGAASFDAMRSRSDLLAPDPGGVLKDRAAFFRRGSSGGAIEIMSAEDLDRYGERVSDLAPDDLLVWLHR
jgi:hypothetical protein